MEKLEKFEKLSTKRLLTYYKKYRKHMLRNLHRKDMLRNSPYNWTKEEYPLNELTLHLLEVKKLLDGREHVE